MHGSPLKNQIALYAEDFEYAKIMAARLSKRTGLLVSVAQKHEDVQKECPGIDLSGRWLSITEICETISEEFPELLRLKAKNGTFVSVLSPCGGSGASTVSEMLGKIYARIYSYKTLLVSFDVFADFCGMQISQRFGAGEELVLKRDEYGLYYLCGGDESLCENPLSFMESGKIEELFISICDKYDFERVVIDVPCGHGSWRQIAFMSESSVVLDSYDGRPGASEFMLAQLRSAGLSPLRFSPSPDEGLKQCDADIHSQLGSEVRALAQRLEA